MSDDYRAPVVGLDKLQGNTGGEGGRLLPIVRLIDHFIDAEGLPGAVWMVRLGQDWYGPVAQGWAQLFPIRRKMQPDTLFDLASLTKVVVTTTLALQAMEEGVFRLDDRLDLFLPGSSNRVVRIRHLLTHTSGLPAWQPLWLRCSTKAEVVNYLCRLPLAYEPGSRVVYSCLGFILLGAILERLLGASLDELASERIFRPCSMAKAAYNPICTSKAAFAATEFEGLTREYLCGVVHDENARFLGGVSGNAGLFARAEDLANFVDMLLANGCFQGKRVLSRPAIDLATQPHTEGLGELRGLGWALSGRRPYCSAGDLLSPQAFGHTGFTGTSLWLDPHYEAAFILLTNRVHPTRENNAHIRLRPLFHNLCLAALMD